jgi:Zn-finger nucleic acid-binding protein
VSVQLVETAHEGRPVLACTHCAGVFLDPVAAGRLLAPLGHDLQPTGRPGAHQLRCPSCGTAMQSCHTYTANVELDRCHPHGVWFDRDELAHIAHTIARMQGHAAPAMPAPYRSVPVQTSWGPAAAAGGVALVGGAMVGTGMIGGGPGNSQGSQVGEALMTAADGVVPAMEVGGAVVDVAADAAPAVVEGGASVLEAAGDLIGGLFGGLADLFS